MEPLRLVVVGGGIAGLAGARAAALARARSSVPLEVTILESSPRLGGKVWTETVEGQPLEWGPDSFLAAKPWARRLAEELGLSPDLVAPGPAAARTYLWLRGRLRPLPRGLAMGIPTRPGSLLRLITAGVVGPLAALRAAVEPLLPALPDDDMSVAEVARRRLGRQVASRLVAPLVGGVFRVPAEELSMAAALPQLAGARSLVLAMTGRPRASGPVFLSLRGGMGRLVDRLVEALPEADIRLSCPALSVDREGSGFRIVTPAGDLAADAALLATPATAASQLLASLAPEAAAALEGIRYRAAVVVHLRYAPSALAQPLDASGYLVAPEEAGAVVACTWVGPKWPHLADGRPRLRALVTDSRAVALRDRELRDRVASEVGRAMRTRKDAEDVRLVRWPDALPVYAPGHRDRVAAALRALPSRVALAGAAYGGVGIPDCIRTGEEGARRLVAALGS